MRELSVHPTASQHQEKFCETTPCLDPKSIDAAVRHPWIESMLSVLTE